MLCAFLDDRDVFGFTVVAVIDYPPSQKVVARVLLVVPAVAGIAAQHLKAFVPGLIGDPGQDRPALIAEVTNAARRTPRERAAVKTGGRGTPLGDPVRPNGWSAGPT